jgi:hypothetical protein
MDGVIRCGRLWLVQGERARSNLKNSNNEPMKFTKSRIEVAQASVVPAGRTCFVAGFPGTSSVANFRCRFATLLNCGREAGGGGKRWSGMSVELGKGGQEIGKWRSFSHFETTLTRLFPPFSTQVVDFPHLAMVSIFWEERFHRRDAETQRQARIRTNFEESKAEPQGHGGTEPSGAWNQGGETEKNHGNKRGWIQVTEAELI